MDESTTADDEISHPDRALAVELQSKYLDQLTTVSLGGAGLVISLAGTVLAGSRVIWLPAIEFGLAALVAMSAQHHLIEALYDGKPLRKRVRAFTLLTMVLIGMAVGSLAMTVWKQNKPKAPAAAAATPPPASR